MKKKEVIAICIAPVASGFLQGLVMGNLAAFIFAVIFSYIFSVIIGFPALYILNRNRLEKFWHYIFAGILGGLCVGIVIAILVGFENGYYSFASIFMDFLLLSFHGVLVSSIYWLIAFLKVSENV